MQALTLVFGGGALAFALAASATVASGPSGDPTIDANLTKDYLECRKGVVAVRPLQHCTGLEIERQLKMLDNAVNRHRARLHGEDAKKQFDDDQAKWRQSVDDKCRPVGRGLGSMHATNAQHCFLEADILRRLELEKQK